MRKIPQATHIGVLKIGEIEIPCAVLEGGTRVLTQSGFLRALGRSARPSGQGKQKAGFEQLPAFLRAKSLNRYITKGILDSTRPIQFVPTHGGRAIGYKAQLLPQICDVFLSARRDGLLMHQQIRLADQCEILMRGFAHVGITALVDEATGYQADRSSRALAEIFERFIAKEYRKWLKTFPDDFYEQMFRLKGWSDKPITAAKPPLVAKYTNNLVYERLAPNILDELQRVNPKDEKGKRRQKHHQWLTSEVGHPSLREHLAAVIALMKASSNWVAFNKAMDRALPRYNCQIPLPGVDEDDE